MIKRIFLCLICALLLIPGTVFAKAESLPRLVDNGDLLTSLEETALLTKLNAVSEEYNCDIIVATAATLGNYNVEEYSDKFYKESNYGMGEYKDGFMLLICLEYRDWALTSYGNAGAKFNDSAITNVRESIMPYLSEEEFFEAFDIFAEECEYILEQPDSASAEGSEMPSILLLALIAIAVGIIIAFIVVLIMKSKLKSVRSQPAANNYLKIGSLMLTTQRDIFLYSTITRRAKPQQSSVKIGAPGPRQSGKF